MSGVPLAQPEAQIKAPAAVSLRGASPSSVRRSAPMDPVTEHSGMEMCNNGGQLQQMHAPGYFAAQVGGMPGGFHPC